MGKLTAADAKALLLALNEPEGRLPTFPHPAQFINPPLATGKSRKTWQRVASLPDDCRIVIAVPTVDLVRETVAALKTMVSDPTDVGQYISQTYEDRRSGEPICELRNMVVEAASRLGAETTHYCIKRKKKCEYLSTCEFGQELLRHREKRPRILVTTHASMGHLPVTYRKRHDDDEPIQPFHYIVIDEDAVDAMTPERDQGFDQKALKVATTRSFEVAASKIIRGDAARWAAKLKEAEETLAAVDAKDFEKHFEAKEAVEKLKRPSGKHKVKGRSLTGADYRDIAIRIYKELWDSGVDGRRVNAANLPTHTEIEQLHRIIRYDMLKPPLVEPNPGVTEADAVKKEHLRQGALLVAAELLSWLLPCITSPLIDEDGNVGGIRVRMAPSPKIAVHQRRIPHDLFTAPAVILSSTASPLLLRQLFPNLRMTREEEPETFEDGIPMHRPRWPMEKHARYFRVLSRGGGSKSSLLDRETGALTEHGLDVADAIRSMGHRYQGKVLIVCQKDVRIELQKLEMPENVDIENFKAVEGQNRWSNVDAVFIVGRPQPIPDAIQLRAEVLAGRVIEMDPEDIHFPNRDYWDIFVKRNGTVGGRKLTEPHYPEDEVVNALLKASCTGAVTQADRSRARWRGPENPVDIFVMNNLDLPFPFEDHIRLSDIFGWYHQMAEKGIVVNPKAARTSMYATAAEMLPEVFGPYPDDEDGREAQRRAVASKDVDLDAVAGMHGFRYPRKISVKLKGDRYYRNLIIESRPLITRGELEDLLRQRVPKRWLQLISRIRIPRS